MVADMVSSASGSWKALAPSVGQRLVDMRRRADLVGRHLAMKLAAWPLASAISLTACLAMVW
jgi:hypothetical protein